MIPFELFKAVVPRVSYKKQVREKENDEVFHRQNRPRLVYTHVKSGDQSLDKTSFDFFNVFRAKFCIVMNAKSSITLYPLLYKLCWNFPRIWSRSLKWIKLKFVKFLYYTSVRKVNHVFCLNSFTVCPWVAGDEVIIKNVNANMPVSLSWFPLPFLAFLCFLASAQFLDSSL